MVASKNLKQGELILKEEPILIGSQLTGPTSCFNCCKLLDLREVCFCGDCNTALLCKKDCKGKFHNNPECSILKNLNIKGQYLVENCQVIFPLRCLLLKQHNQDIFEKIMALESHLDERRNHAIWRRYKISVENVLKEMNVLQDDNFDDDEIQTICGILDVNTFEVRPPISSDLAVTKPETQCLRGLYLEAAMMAHDCLANVHLSVDDSLIMTIHASVDIKKNEPILFNYANVLQGNQLRQEHLLEGKYFICKCKRCQDPTELGTEISSLVCHKCRRGYLRLNELEENFKMWQCSDCNVCFKRFLIDLAVEEARRKIEDVDHSNIQEMEKLCKKLVMTFHPSHYLLLELKQDMVALYTKLPPNKTNLNRKIDLCGKLLSTFTKLEPGISRIRALTMYELQSAIVCLSNKQYKNKEINKENLVSELSTAEIILKESVKYLLYEPVRSPEGRFAQVALRELKMLRNSIKNIQQDCLMNVDEINDKRNEVSKRLKEKLEKSKGSSQKDENEKENVKFQSDAIKNDLNNKPGKSVEKSRRKNKK